MCMNLATKKMDKPRFDLSQKKLDLDPDKEVYETTVFTPKFAQARGVAAGKQRAPYKLPLEPPVGGEAIWIKKVSSWIEYVMSPANGEVQELITRRGQYLQNMADPKKTLKKQLEACKSFNDMNKQLREKFLLPPRDALNFYDALKNNDDVADFLRANNLMK